MHKSKKETIRKADIRRHEVRSLRGSDASQSYRILSQGSFGIVTADGNVKLFFSLVGERSRSRSEYGVK